MMARSTRFSEPLLNRIIEAIEVGDVIVTVSMNQPNRIVAIKVDRIVVETERSVKRDTGPRAVPAWMVQVAWDYLTRHGSLTNQHLLNALNVKRSSFVCALLARFPDVDVVSERPLTLRHRPQP